MEVYTEKDWKLFKKKLGSWQEHYIEKLIEQYKKILDSDSMASEKFWKLEKRIYRDKKKTGVLARDVCRSNMPYHILNLLQEKAITFDDLEEFSDDFKGLCAREV